jgi:hypothetical protein
LPDIAGPRQRSATDNRSREIADFLKPKGVENETDQNRRNNAACTVQIIFSLALARSATKGIQPVLQATAISVSTSGNAIIFCFPLPRDNQCYRPLQGSKAMEFGHHGIVVFRPDCDPDL